MALLLSILAESHRIIVAFAHPDEFGELLLKFRSIVVEDHVAMEDFVAYLLGKSCVGLRELQRILVGKKISDP